MELKSFEFKTESTEDEGIFTGYLSVFGVKDTYGDVVEPGAFSASLQEKDSFPLLNCHDPDQLLGDFEGKEDDHGLFIKGRLILGIQTAREKFALLKANVLTGLSIGFETIKDEWDRVKEVRYLKEIKLWGGFLVTFPANPMARVQGVKDGEQYTAQINDLQGTATALEQRATLSDRYVRDLSRLKAELKSLIKELRTINREKRLSMSLEDYSKNRNWM